jgi:TolA-binding protein
MRIANSLYLIVCLSITVLMLVGYNEFTNYFNQGKDYQAQVKILEHELEKVQFKNALLQHQLIDFQESVAAVLPANSKISNDVANYRLKNFATGLRAPASESEIDLSGIVFEKGKKLFNEAKYERALKEFQKINEEYPLSSYKVESDFFTAESYFLQKDYKSSLDVINKMVQQYPDHPLTGFIMLRMGQISELNNRPEEAGAVYKTVQAHFKDSFLKSQAAKLAAGLTEGSSENPHEGARAE